MTHPSRAKGNRFESELIRELADRGIFAKKVPLSGSLGGEHSHDLVLPATGKRVEAKHRQRIGLADLYNWVAKGPNYILMRRNRSDILVVMTLDEWAELIRRKEDDG